MGDNLKIQMLREDIVNTLNAYALPIEVKRMVLKEALSGATEMSQTEIQKEREEYIKEKQNEH